MIWQSSHTSSHTSIIIHHSSIIYPSFIHSFIHHFIHPFRSNSGSRSAKCVFLGGQRLLAGQGVAAMAEAEAEASAEQLLEAEAPANAQPPSPQTGGSAATSQGSASSQAAPPGAILAGAHPEVAETALALR